MYFILLKIFTLAYVNVSYCRRDLVFSACSLYLYSKKLSSLSQRYRATHYDS